MLNLFKNDEKRYYSLNSFYRKKFGKKVFKISLNGGFTCPNIDGTVGKGGCIYCSAGGGDFGGNPNEDLSTQFSKIKNMMHQKWKSALYIGYFQSNTNTYAPVSELKKKYETILNEKNVVGLSVSTRPDAISDEVLDYLEELNEKTFLTIELGLQTIHPATTILINRCHTLKTFEDMVYKLKERDINIVVHIINGLPYETKEMMIKTVEYLNRLPINGLKIHMLSIAKNTKLEKIWKKEKFALLDKETYVDIVCEQIKVLRPDIVLHRLTGDPKITDLVEPKWLVKKFEILNEIDSELEKRNINQGDEYKKDE